MKPRLLVLIDFSLVSEALLKLAGAWSRILNANILVVHQLVVMAPAMADYDSRSQIAAIEKAEALARLKAMVKTAISGPAQVSYHVTDVPLVTCLPELLVGGNNNIILAGLKGTGVFKHIFIGSTATELIEKVNALLVAVPLHVSPAAPEKAVISLSYKFPLNQTAFDHFLEMFKGTLTQVEFITVVTPADSEAESHAYLQGLTDNYKQKVKATYQVFTGDAPFAAIKKHVAGQNNSLLIVQKGSRSLTDFLFRKYLINEIVHDGSLPLLILPL